LARRISAEQNARGIPVRLVDAGDFTDGTVFSAEYHGLADLEAMARRVTRARQRRNPA
jgi:2',3'-cyclic-nucleotide 2'-phosphodiesterase (5'-nucleotidase family)